jgi:mannosyltransferase OCH1-like enzyme
MYRVVASLSPHCNHVSSTPLRRKMRKRTRKKPFLPFFFLLLLTSLFLVAFLFSRVYTLITLLFEDGARDLIDREELNRLRREGVADEKIPKIIHQTYANESVTGRWEVAQMTCVKLHAGWEYMVSGRTGDGFAHQAEG